MGGSIFCEAKQTQDHDRSCEGSPGEWSDELEANSFDVSSLCTYLHHIDHGQSLQSGIDQLPDRKILFPALWQYSRLSKTIPRERVGKANCVNDSDDTDARESLELLHERLFTPIFNSQIFSTVPRTVTSATPRTARLFTR